MTSILVHRLELAGRIDHALDADVVHWLAEDVGMGQTELGLRHTRGLVGCLSGARRVIDDLFPRAHWAISSHPRAGAIVFYGTLVPAGAGTVFNGSAGDPANALLAATVRAFEAGARTIPFAANDRGRAA